MLDSHSLMKQLKSLPADVFTDISPQGTILVQRHSEIRISKGDAENDLQVSSDSQFSADRVGITRGHGLGAGAQAFRVSRQKKSIDKGTSVENGPGGKGLVHCNKEGAGSIEELEVVTVRSHHFILFLIRIDAQRFETPHPVAFRPFIMSLWP